MVFRETHGAAEESGKRKRSLLFASSVNYNRNGCMRVRGLECNSCEN